MPLNIIISGAGIASLAAAIGLRRHGHQVSVCERRSPLKREESGSGIQIQPNVAQILQQWGLLVELQKVAHDNLMANLNVYDTGLVVKVDFGPNGPAWYGLRMVLKDLFRDHALKAGVKIFEDAKIQRVDAEGPAVILEDGAVVQADLIIGADGSNSRVRRSLLPDFEPKVLSKACFQVVIPLDTVQNDPVLKDLVDGSHNTVTVAPDRSIFASPALYQNQYDLQLIDHEYTLEQDPHPDFFNERISDLTWLRKRWSDHSPAIRKALALADSTFKWRFVKVFGVPSWSSRDGKVVLMGDAVHSMTPYAGQGSAMGIEDAAVLSELLANASPGDDLRPLMNMYEKIRRSRCEKVQSLARSNGRAWGMKDAEQVRKRNKMWQRLNDPAYHTAKPDGSAPFGSPGFTAWLDRYDVFEVVQQERNRSKL